MAATLAGSSASSQPRGLPVSTAQKRQAPVQTAPRTMIVAVPAFQHSPMLGHLAPSQTVARRGSRTLRRPAPYPAPAASGPFPHVGLARAGPAPGPPPRAAPT